MKSNQKRANGKTKAIVALSVVLVVTILLGIIGFTGAGFLGIPRWLPTANTDNWPESLPLGLDLQGGVYVEFTGVPTRAGVTFDDVVDGAIDMIRDRLTNAGQTEANIQRIGTNGIRIEIPIRNTASAAQSADTGMPDAELASPTDVIAADVTSGDDNPDAAAPAEQSADTATPEEGSTEEPAPETEATADAEPVADEPADEAEITADAEPAADETAGEAEITADAEPAAEETASAETASEDEHDHNHEEEAEATATTRAEGEYIEDVLARSASKNKEINLSDNDAIKTVLDLIGEPAVMRFVDPTGYVFMYGDHVKHADAFVNSNAEVGSSQYQIAFELDEEGAKIFAEWTNTYKGYNIAIYLDDRCLVNARVQSVITDGKGTITGNYTQEEAIDVANKINAGALPLELTQDKVDMVSATLGQDALSTSVTAALIGILLIMALMIFRYRLNGAIASWALTIYIILLFGLIALFKVQLTLSGLAGIVLGIGMAVDANVIIFERFNEEARKGRSAKASVRAGFKNAISAILDANITTLIAAIVLMIFGTGSIQGFAYTLLLGVIVSMITAVLVTRFLMNWFVDAGCTEIRLFTKVKAEEEVAQ